MLKVFSLPILTGIILGVLFPYQSMSLIWLSSILLFVLLFLNTVAIGLKQLIGLSKMQFAQSAVTMGLMFFVLQVMLTALAFLVLNDRDFVLGVVVAACAPSALVNPFFARLRGADSALALLNVVISSVLCPLMIVLTLQWSGFADVFIDVKALASFLLALTVLPLIAALLLVKVWPVSSALVAPRLPWINSFLLATLMFILVGCSLHQVPLRLLLKGDLAPLVLLFAVFEFGVFFVMREAARKFVANSAAETLALSLSTRNFAVSASLLLFFYPKAALPSAIGLMIHAAFFQWLARNDSALQKPLS